MKFKKLLSVKRKYGRNLLTNGSFETADFSGWVHDTSYGTAADETTIVCQGSHSVKLPYVTGYPVLSQDIVVKPLHQYMLRFCARKHNQTLKAECLDHSIPSGGLGSGDFSPDPSTTPDNVWVNYKIVYLPDSGCNNITLYFYLFAETIGECYFDKTSFREIL